MSRIVLEDLSKETLIKLIKLYSRNWNTVDGLWFRAVEEEFGLDTATRIDMKMWETNIQIEAKRLMQVLPLEGDSLDIFCKIIDYSTSIVGGYFEHDFERTGPDTIVFTYTGCLAQEARIKQGLPEFSCKQVGHVIHEKLAEVINPRIQIKCLYCPPDSHPEDIWCKWELKLAE